MSGIYYPLVAAVFTLRFDELLLNGSIPAPGSSESLAKEGGSSGGPASQKPALLSGAKDRLSKKIGIIPKTASLELPGYRQAPKFSMSIAWHDLPIDPRSVRALGVEIYVGAVDGSSFARSMLGRDSYSSLVKSLTDKPENLMVAGVADNISTSFDEKGSALTMDGRGLQGIFLDARVHPDSLKDLKVDKPINKLVEELLSRSGLSKNIPVETDPASEWPGGQVPAVAAKEVVTRINKGTSGDKANMGTKGDNSTLLFWDLVTNFCFLVGAVPYFNGHTLHIRPAVNLYKRRQQSQQGKTPFRENGKENAQRKVKTGSGKEEQFSIRRMVYGRNLLKFALSRKTAGASKLPTVRVVCVDPDAGRGKEKLLEVRWPEDSASDKQKATNVAPNGGESQQELMTVPVYGVKSEVRLKQIARALYEEIARGELSGSASTKDLASLGGNNSDADLIRLRPGDPVDFFVDASGLRVFPPIVSEANLRAAQSPSEAKRKLAEQLGDSDLAELIVGTARGQFQGLQDTFHVQTVKYSWDVESGLAVDFDFQNYVEARFDGPKQATTVDETVEEAGLAAESAAEKALNRKSKQSSVNKP